jgi:antitoxin HicB
VRCSGIPCSCLVPEFPYLSALAPTPQKAVREAVIVTEAVLEALAEDGLQPPKPQILSSFSGQIRVRMPRTLHRKLAGRARMEDVSLNTLIVSLLAQGIGAAEDLPLVECTARRPKGRSGEAKPQSPAEPGARAKKRATAGGQV